MQTVCHCRSRHGKSDDVVVLGFEDMRVTEAGYDGDFNDLLVSVSERAGRRRRDSDRSEREDRDDARWGDWNDTGHWVRYVEPVDLVSMSLAGIRSMPSSPAFDYLAFTKPFMPMISTLRPADPRTQR
jgi:hypothetical protein